MIKQLASWSGKVLVNGQQYGSIADVPNEVLNGATTITLLPLQKFEKQTVQKSDSNAEHIITVRPYMTKPATLEFDFMDKWNNGVPMPMRTMQGVIVKETKGMVYMKLHGLGKPAVYCVRCGKELTNPVSRHYGLGIECIQKVGIVRDINDIDGIKEDLVNISWEGWLPKSSIIKEEIVNNGSVERRNRI